MREYQTDILIAGGGLGGVAGALAAHCLNEKLEPAQVRSTPARLADFQALLAKMGVRLAWTEYARITPR